MIRVGIIGASGYAGGEVVRYLLLHPEFRITYLASDTFAGRHIGEAFPNLLKADLPLCESFDKAAFDKADVFVLAHGNGWAMNEVPALLDAEKKVVDMSADFRFRSADIYEQWYSIKHKCPEMLRKAVFGLPELRREEIVSADLVGNPGCYPTSAILAAAPALSERLIEPGGLVFDAKSGVSGAGRSRTEVGYLFSEVDESLKPYNIGVHRHIPEIEQELSAVSGVDMKVSFTPHLVPMVRGILTTAYANLAKSVETGDVLDVYRRFYADSPFVVVLDEGCYPATKAVSGSNYAHVGLKVDKRTNRLVVVCAIDNMGKGAAGQAVQNLNLMFGLPETMGLVQPAVYP